MENDTSPSYRDSVTPLGRSLCPSRYHYSESTWFFHSCLIILFLCDAPMETDIVLEREIFQSHLCEHGERNEKDNSLGEPCSDDADPPEERRRVPLGENQSPASA